MCIRESLSPLQAVLSGYDLSNTVNIFHQLPPLYLTRKVHELATSKVAEHKNDLQSSRKILIPLLPFASYRENEPTYISQFATYALIELWHHSQAAKNNPALLQTFPLHEPLQSPNAWNYKSNMTCNQSIHLWIKLHHYGLQHGSCLAKWIW